MKKKLSDVRKHFLSSMEHIFQTEKNLLILEACKRHDWGKANLLFQALMFNPEVDEETKLDSRKLEQIPHGFLSAVTISKSEFLKLSEEFSEEDLVHLLQPFIIITTGKMITMERKSENMEENIICSR